jgi:hypothetical protein
MIELRDWIQRSAFEDRPWLVLGKGPSFSRRDEFPLEDHNLLSLNHVVGEQKVDVAHIIDMDVVEALGDRLAANAGHVLMPRRPHVKQSPGTKLLEDYFDEVPVLKQLDEQGKLVWYNAATSNPVGDSPVIGIRYFSSEAAFNLLGEMGVKKVSSLGLDGGTLYGQEFKDLTPLANTRPSFDAQFREIEDIVRDRSMDYDPLIEHMRVYVGLDESQIVAARVLEYSIRKHASRPVRIIPMLDVPTPEPEDPDNRGRTGFSFSRFHIPKLAGYKGRALYVDADMQVFSDLAELWDIPFGDKKVLVTRQDQPPEKWKGADWFKPGRQMSVMLLDCERLSWDIDEIIGGMDEGRYGYRDLMFDLCVVPDEEIGDNVPPEWNHLEHFEPGKTKLLHYTVVPTQPWKADNNPLGEIWHKEFEQAMAAGIVRGDEVTTLAEKRHIKRSLAGLPPERFLRRLQGLLARLDERFPVFRHPRLLRVRVRLARALLRGS